MRIRTTNLNFVFDEIIKKVQFPIIYSNAMHDAGKWTKSIRENFRY